MVYHSRKRKVTRLMKISNMTIFLNGRHKVGREMFSSHRRCSWNGLKWQTASESVFQQDKNEWDSARPQNPRCLGTIFGAGYSFQMGQQCLRRRRHFWHGATSSSSFSSSSSSQGATQSVSFIYRRECICQGPRGACARVALVAWHHQSVSLPPTTVNVTCGMQFFTLGWGFRTVPKSCKSFSPPSRPFFKNTNNC